jgi:hypothetical protein
VWKTKEEVAVDRKRKHENTRREETAAALLSAKTEDLERALEQDNSQWTGDNALLTAADVIRLDAADALFVNNNIA